jgi:hypothetical protein
MKPEPGRDMADETGVVVVVSGLPRSGTSMAMRMLQAGGIPLLVDGERGPDEDNPLGYFELEGVKRIRQDPSWLECATGRAVKVVSPLLRYLPSDRRYRVIFLERPLSEVLASQRAMIKRRGGEEPSAADDEAVARQFERHLSEVRAWLQTQAHVEVLFLQYGQTVADPRAQAEAMALFLDMPLDVMAMAAAVDPTLYRQRQR